LKISKKSSGRVYSPCGVSSFFEICDTNPDGSKIENPLLIGARGGGFIIKRGTKTRAFFGDGIKSDSVLINGKLTPDAKTSLQVIRLMREKYEFAPVRVVHEIEPPIGSGFGTSGAGAVSTAIVLSDLFDLKLSLSEVSAFAHTGEIHSLTGLGTVISLVSGSGAMGLVTEPGSYSIGRVDSILADHSRYTLICACFGPIEKSSVLINEGRRRKVNEFGRQTLDAILDEPTPESLLKHSRRFAEASRIGGKELLTLADKAVRYGALGATQNMIGNAVHCLVEKSSRRRFLDQFTKHVPRENLFETDLTQSGPIIRKNSERNI